MKWTWKELNSTGHARKCHGRKCHERKWNMEWHGMKRKEMARISMKWCEVEMHWNDALRWNKVEWKVMNWDEVEYATLKRSTLKHKHPFLGHSKHKKGLQKVLRSISQCPHRCLPGRGFLKVALQLGDIVIIACVTLALVLALRNHLTDCVGLLFLGSLDIGCNQNRHYFFDSASHYCGTNISEPPSASSTFWLPSLHKRLWSLLAPEQANPCRGGRLPTVAHLPSRNRWEPGGGLPKHNNKFFTRFYFKSLIWNNCGFQKDMQHKVVSQTEPWLGGADKSPEARRNLHWSPTCNFSASLIMRGSCSKDWL